MKIGGGEWKKVKNEGAKVCGDEDWFSKWGTHS
jgi:hypothetical protein